MAARRIRDLSLPPKPYIVAVTGYGTDEDKHRSGDAGFDLHLLKPVDPQMYRGLAALLQSSRGLVYESRMLAAQYRDTATEVMFRQLEMANRYLDTAGLGNSGERKERCMGLATRSYERLITWADTGACADEKGAELVNGLRTLNERLKSLNLLYAEQREKRKPMQS